MSCMWCAHWSRPYKVDWRSGDTEGMCTLNPVWITTTGKHYCSQIMQNADNIGGSTNTFNYNCRAHESYNEMLAEKNRRIAVEKSAKDLRAEIKRLKTNAKSKL